MTTRDEVVTAFRRFVEAGYLSPDQLPSRSPAVIAANRLYSAWCKEHLDEALVSLDLAERLRASCSLAMVHVDAGFTEVSFLSAKSRILGRYHLEARRAHREALRREIFVALRTVQDLLCAQVPAM